MKLFRSLRSAIPHNTTDGFKRLPVSAQRLSPTPLERTGLDQESQSSWGFRDSYFFVNKTGSVQLAGNRYPLSGQDLPDLLPWMETTLGVKLKPKDVGHKPNVHRIPPSRANPNLIDSLKTTLSNERVILTDEHRERRAHGHALREILSVHEHGFERIPDVVVEPENAEEITCLVQIARSFQACLVPYGGGTNVSLALQCPSQENRPIISIDMRRMRKILWIDQSNHTAHIEAGAVGRHIQTQLSDYGFTLGHEPDSIEFSTLGGWIATRASGMKKNRYGNIEDLVLSIGAVGHEGFLNPNRTFSRESTGPALKDSFLGSEGALGIVTSAIVKIFPIPQRQLYGSVIFPDFRSGLQFLYALAQCGNLPASVRLVDNLQFQFGQALKPRITGVRALINSIKKIFVTKVVNYSPQEITACTFLYEGDERSCSDQKKYTMSLAKRFGGISGGSENGKSGYDLTFNIAYIRDFALKYGILGESFETSVCWTDLPNLCANVKNLVHKEHQRRDLSSRPFITCRVTQLYETGVCLYFYLALHTEGLVSPKTTFAAIEKSIREEILRSGGSLSHHHGVGKIRQDFLKEVFSPETLSWRKNLKHAMDPENLFSPGNLYPVED